MATKSKRRFGARARSSGRGAGGKAVGSAALDLFEQTTEAVRTALNQQDQWLRSSAEFAERSGRWLENQQQWHKAAMSGAMAARRSMQASADLLERTSRTGVAWMQTAMELAWAPGAAWEAGMRGQELSLRSVDLLQSTVRAIADAHRDAVESWGAVMRSGGQVAKTAAQDVEKVGRLSRAAARGTTRSSARAARKLVRSAASTTGQAVRAA